MNQLTRKPTTHDALESIFCDWHYPSVTSPTGWRLSQDIQDECNLLFMEQAEQFVESVARSAKLPFTFDKSLAGTTLKSRNRLGELFYSLLRPQNDSPYNPGEFKPFLFSATLKTHHAKYEVSENLKTLSDVASALNLNRASFTGNPMSIIGADGLREGELINSVVSGLWKAMQRTSFITKAAKRKKQFTQNFTTAKKYMARLYASSPSLYGMRMVTCYPNTAPVTLEESAKHLMKFLEAFALDASLGSPVGWWWKREYITELNYCYYLIVFFDDHRTPVNLMRLHEAYDLCWRSITQERGASFVPLVPKRDYQRRVSEWQQHVYCDSSASFISSIQRMLMRDIFLRLEPSQMSVHVGMGKLPKVEHCSLPNVALAQPYSSFSTIHHGI